MNTATTIVFVIVVVLALGLAAYYFMPFGGGGFPAQKRGLILGEPGYVAPSASAPPAGFSSSSVTEVA